MSSKVLKFYTDKHIPKAVAVQLRVRGIDVVRCEDVGMGDAKDVEHLEYATAEGRAVITRDKDFPRLDTLWRSQGKDHAGIFYCLSPVQGKAAVGKVINGCLEYYELIIGGAGTVEQDIVNQVIFVR
jgi:hypothetical protein